MTNTGVLVVGVYIAVILFAALAGSRLRDLEARIVALGSARCECDSVVVVLDIPPGGFVPDSLRVVPR